MIGGTYVNISCVPSKLLIHGAHIAHLQGHHNVECIPLNRPITDRRAMVAQQQRWVEKLRRAKYESILERNPSITLLHGMGALTMQAPYSPVAHCYSKKILNLVRN